MDGGDATDSEGGEVRGTEGGKRKQREAASRNIGPEPKCIVCRCVGVKKGRKEGPRGEKRERRGEARRGVRPDAATRKRERERAGNAKQRVVDYCEN